MIRLDHITLDAPDIERLASFYAHLTGWHGWGADRPGSPWPTRPGTRSICVSVTAWDR
jgi:catechol 2,3-dioxygenase-like lactoylglutathione lyase family enzyme